MVGVDVDLDELQREAVAVPILGLPRVGHAGADGDLELHVLAQVFDLKLAQIEAASGVDLVGGVLVGARTLVVPRGVLELNLLSF